MIRFNIRLLSGLVLALAAAPGCSNSASVSSTGVARPDDKNQEFEQQVEEVRCLLRKDFGEPNFAHPAPPDAKGNRSFAPGEAELIRRGELIFPAFEAILTDPKSDDILVCGVFQTLIKMDGPRQQFIRYAVAGAWDYRSAVRHCAVNLLGVIGGAREAAVVVRLLSDLDGIVGCAAARTLAAIGSKQELAAMDTWLQDDDPRFGPEYRAYVRKQRDKLEVRLKAAPGKI